MSYDPQFTWTHADHKVALAILKACHDFGADRLELLAAFETAIVESGIKALDYGDRDSLGAFQQRAGWGSREDRIDPYKSALAFLAEARRLRKRFSTAGRLAYAVQRCAYAYRGRYRQAYPAAKFVIEKARALRAAQAAPKLSVRRAAAIAWMVEESANPTRDRTNECLRTVRISLGVPARADWAIHAWDAAQHKHTSSIPQAGTPYFFKGSGKYGHIVLVDTPGKDVDSTTVWSTDIKRHGKVDKTTIGYIKSHWAMRGLGWATDLNGVDI